MGGTLTTEDFDCPWTNREGARRLVLVLPPLNERHSHIMTYKRQGLMGDNPISGEEGCEHKHAMEHLKSIVRYSTINVMKVNISLKSGSTKLCILGF